MELIYSESNLVSMNNLNILTSCVWDAEERSPISLPLPEKELCSFPGTKSFLRDLLLKF